MATNMIKPMSQTFGADNFARSRYLRQRSENLIRSSAVVVGFHVVEDYLPPIRNDSTTSGRTAPMMQHHCGNFKA